MPEVGLTPGLSATPPLDGLPNTFNFRWLRLFRDQGSQIAANPSRVTTITEATQSASIPTTAIGTDPLAEGLYRVSAYVRVTSPAATSSSIAVSIAWSDGGVTCSAVLVAAVTGNTTSSTGAGTLLVHIDASTPISYSATYASNAAAEMVYTLSIVLENMGQG